MLNSGSEYLEDLRKEYQGKLACTDMNLLNEKIYPADEQQLSEMIENIRHQSNHKENADDIQMESAPVGKKNYDATPDQFKINAYD